MTDILKSTCTDNDGNCYLKGLKDSDEPAHVSVSLFRRDSSLMISHVLTVPVFMEKNKRSTKSMGPHNVEFKNVMKDKRTYNLGEWSSHYYRRFYNPKEPGEKLGIKDTVAKKIKNLVSGR